MVEKAWQTRRGRRASVAVIKDGRVVLSKGYGLSDIGNQIRATEQTIYQLGSMTKPFTAMAMLMLVEDGGCRSTPGSHRDPTRHAGRVERVTVRHLLSHTSGIKSYTEVFGAKKVSRQSSRPMRSSRWSRMFRWRSRPGSATPTQHRLLPPRDDHREGVRQALRKVHHRANFEPLEMTSTSLDDYADARPVRAKGYASTTARPRPRSTPTRRSPYAAGASLKRPRPREVERCADAASC